MSLRTMAISHLCLSCGFDLARVRRRLDPHYALPLVVCPDCGQAAVRRMHPAQRAWRTVLRLETSLLALAWQVALLVGFASAVVAVCIIAAERWVRGDLTAPQHPGLTVAVLALVALPVSLGAWLTAGLAHMQRFAAWIFFSTLVLAMISLDCVGEPLIERLIDACGLSVTPHDFRWDRFTARLVVLAAIVAVAAAGIPPGLAARAGYHRWRRHRWRARRGRLRARSTVR